MDRHVQWIWVNDVRLGRLVGFEGNRLAVGIAGRDLFQWVNAEIATVETHGVDVNVPGPGLVQIVRME